MKPTKNRYFCPDARRTKMLFETEGSAKRFIQFNSEEILEDEGKAPVRAYYCVACAGWHVTSLKEKGNFKSRIERYFENREIIVDALKTKQQCVDDLIKITNDYVNAKTEKEILSARTQFNILSDKIRKYNKDERMSKHICRYIPIITRLGRFFANRNLELKEVFADIKTVSPQSFSEMRYIVKRIKKL